MSFTFLQWRLDQCDPRALYSKFEQSLKGAVAIDIVPVNNNFLWKDIINPSISNPVESNLGNQLSRFKLSVSLLIFSRQIAASASSLIVKQFQGVSCSKNSLHKEKDYRRCLFYFGEFYLLGLPSSLFFQFVLKLRTLVLQPASQNQIIVRNVPLMHHCHVFFFPVDRRE